MWDRVRRPLGVIVPIIGFFGLAFGLRADAGDDLSRLVNGVADNWVVAVLFAATLGFGLIAWWPSLRRWLLGESDAELRERVRHWLDDRMGFTVDSFNQARLERDSPGAAFQVDAQLYRRSADREPVLAYALTVLRPRNERWLQLGVRWGMTGEALGAFAGLSRPTRAERVQQAAVALATIGVRWQNITQLIADPAAQIALTERLYLDHPLTETRFQESVQHLRYALVALVTCITALDVGLPQADPLDATQSLEPDTSEGQQSPKPEASPGRCAV